MVRAPGRGRPRAGAGRRTRCDTGPSQGLRQGLSRGRPTAACASTPPADAPVAPVPDPRLPPAARPGESEEPNPRNLHHRHLQHQSPGRVRPESPDARTGPGPPRPSGARAPQAPRAELKSSTSSRPGNGLGSQRLQVKWLGDEEKRFREADTRGPVAVQKEFET